MWLNDDLTKSYIFRVGLGIYFLERYFFYKNELNGTKQTIKKVRPRPALILVVIQVLFCIAVA